MLIMGIETSCDETSVAVVENGSIIRSNLVSSQIDLHRCFGGVVPEIASRHHLETVNLMIEQALSDAGISKDSLDAIAVSHGPGLVGALLVGVATAKALAYALKRPLVAVNHLEGHIYANFLRHRWQDGHGAPGFPFVGLIVSGGHTELVYSPRAGELSVMGRTRDDAAGEAFDKIARYLNLGYPGGPVIEKTARAGNHQAIKFPRAYLDADSRYDFSFSGLKSAVINYVHRARQKGDEINMADLAAGFQAAIVDVVTDKAAAAVTEKKPACFLLAGGVAANTVLREQLKNRLSQSAPHTKFFCPPPELCTDNAAMIAAAAYPRLKEGETAPLDLNALPGLSL